MTDMKLLSLEHRGLPELFWHAVGVNRDIAGNR